MHRMFGLCTYLSCYEEFILKIRTVMTRNLNVLKWPYSFNIIQTILNKLQSLKELNLKVISNQLKGKDILILKFCDAPLSGNIYSRLTSYPPEGVSSLRFSSYIMCIKQE